MRGFRRQGAAWLLLGLMLVASGCTRRRVVSPAPAVHYVVGAGYQAGGTWFYPREDFHYDATGLASVLEDTGGLTADGELRDGTAMVAAHQTLQLPAVVRVTNLETGAQVRVRVNDRGPTTPGRLIALSPRAASLLGTSGGGRVRVEVDEGASVALRDQLRGGPVLAVAAAPRGAVQAEALAPPPGVGQSARGRSAGATTVASVEQTSGTAAVPDRLPEVVTRGAAMPGKLMIRAGSFGQMGYARQVAAKLSRIGASVRRVSEGRGERYEVEAGPFGSVSSVDMALDQALRAGVSDARIVVE